MCTYMHFLLDALGAGPVEECSSKLDIFIDGTSVAGTCTCKLIVFTCMIIIITILIS